MIDAKYFGRFGNVLFQHCFGRILATELRYELNAKPIPGFPNTYKKVRGHNYSGYPTQILTGHLIDLPSIINDKTKRKIEFRYGLFQRYEYYKKYKTVIRNNWLLTDREISDRVDPEDIVMCIRRDDYVPYNALPESYYDEALTRTAYKNVHICTDSVNDPFVIRLQHKYNATVRATNTWDNFLFIQKFSKIIIANSSFYWWAAFLSKAQEIYGPIPKQGYWSQTTDIRLTVDDEKRYVPISCKNIYKQSLNEKIIIAEQHIHNVIHKTTVDDMQQKEYAPVNTYVNINKEAQIRIILKIISLLQKNNVTYVFSDIWSLMYYGLKATNRDIDFILDPSPNTLNIIRGVKSELVKTLAPSHIRKDKKYSFEIVTQFASTQFIVYFHFSHSVFDKMCISRKKRVPFYDTSLYSASAEDTIIQRLRWHQKQSKDKHLFNAAFIYHETVNNLNIKYLSFWFIIFHLVRYSEALKNTDILKYF